MRRAGEHEAALPTDRGKAPSRSRRDAPADRMLALQRAVGNRAVGALLARQPRTEPAPASPETRTSHVVVEDIGTIELHSFTWGVNEPGGKHGDELAPHEITLTTRSGKHSAALMRAVVEGRPLGDVVIVYHGGSSRLRITLKGAMGTSYSTGAGGGDPKEMPETWGVHFTQAVFETLPGP